MKINSLVNWTGASVLALSLAILPSIQPASAQTTTPMDPTAPGATTTETDRVAPGTGTTTTTADDNDGFDWGWLGLLGLIGLAGLKGRDRDTTTYDRTATTTTNPSTNPSTNPRY